MSLKTEGKESSADICAKLKKKLQMYLKCNLLKEQFEFKNPSKNLAKLSLYAFNLWERDQSIEKEMIEPTEVQYITSRFLLMYLNRK